MSLKSPRRDGGYAWIVLFAGFMLNVFTSGNFAILGVFLVEFLHHFRVAKATVTWIGALQMFVGNIAGKIPVSKVDFWHCVEIRI